MHFLPDVYVTCEQCKGRPLQPRDARDQVSRQVDRRRARPDRRSGAAAARELSADRQQAADAAGRRPGLHRARAVGDDAQRRRGAAGQAGEGAVEAGAPAGRSTSSTSRRPACTSRTRTSCSTSSTSSSTRATRSSSSSTTWTSSSRPTTSSTSVPEGGEGGGRDRAQGTPEEVAAPRIATGGFLADILGRTRQVERADHLW